MTEKKHGDEKVSGLDSSGNSVDLVALSEYEEYMRLSEHFTGEPLKKLVRKIE